MSKATSFIISGHWILNYKMGRYSKIISDSLPATDTYRGERKLSPPLVIVL
jgi:hypothetical protein